MDNGREPVAKYFGTNVFSEAVMRERLPRNVFDRIRSTMCQGEALDPSIADVVSSAMKDWAIEKGATHFCHWFQPMTGMTAEKHDSFISPTADGRMIMEFSGKELIKGEPDASSFPSGGLRSTFEARGYTAWDCTSPVFVKENGTNITLYIPSAFCSYNSEALDKKTPLLRSMDALNKQAMRVLRALGNTTSRQVTVTLGPEQEYFLVDKKFVEQRTDLILTGRTLFGAPSPKGQELEDHYFGAIHERIASFMNELNTELWKLGVSAKTQHNEVSPGQYELAPVFATVNVATDHNQLTMDTMQKVALHHDMVCLLHEKPFAGVNGSGKHNNWSMVTDDGINLLDPGSTPHENEQFLIFLCAVIKAVDTHAKLLRASVAVAGNDHRLGANEAPPAIVSVFLGDQLTEILDQLSNGSAGTSRPEEALRLGVSTLPPLPMDCTDRNRTSPFAFTGNKFEFRMVGSSQSTAGPMFVLNTAVADALSEIADELEVPGELDKKAKKILKSITIKHRRIIFNGDNYCLEWVKEAAKRGLPNIGNTVDALRVMIEPEAVSLFEKNKVLSKQELQARYEILLERYCKTIRIEALTTINMAKREILPAAMEYSGIVARSLNAVKAAGVFHDGHSARLKEVCSLINSLQEGIVRLEAEVDAAGKTKRLDEQSAAYRDAVIPAICAVRADADRLEMLVDRRMWPFPTYSEMLFLR